MNSVLNKAIDNLKEAEKNLVLLQKYLEADQVCKLIQKLSLSDSVNIKNNQGQINIAGGNSSINASYDTKIGFEK